MNISHYEKFFDFCGNPEEGNNKNNTINALMCHMCNCVKSLIETFASEDLFEQRNIRHEFCGTFAEKVCTLSVLITLFM